MNRRLRFVRPTGHEAEYLEASEVEKRCGFMFPVQGSQASSLLGRQYSSFHRLESLWAGKR